MLSSGIARYLPMAMAVVAIAFILRWRSAIAVTLAAVAIAFILRWQSLHFAPAVGDRCDVGGRRDRSHFALAVIRSLCT